MLQVSSQNICCVQCNGLPCLTPATQLLCSHSRHPAVHLGVFVDFPFCAIGWEGRGSFVAVVVADPHRSSGQGKRKTGSVMMWTPCQVVSSMRCYHEKTHSQISPWNMNSSTNRGLELWRALWWCWVATLMAGSLQGCSPWSLLPLDREVKMRPKAPAEVVTGETGHWQTKGCSC